MKHFISLHHFENNEYKDVNYDNYNTIKQYNKDGYHFVSSYRIFF